MKKISNFTIVVTMCLAILLSAGAVFAAPWKFGVMSDTQWIGTDDGRSPNSVPVDIIKTLNQQFINKGVQFVVQVGDLCDNGSVPAGEDTRAAFAQDLYNAGIGFFPFRGNHDSSKAAAIEFQRIYPQTQNGAMNSTPANVFTVANPDSSVQPFPSVSGIPFTMGSNFSSPVSVTTGTGATANSLVGLTYSFDFNNVRFVLLDGQAAAGTDNITPGIDPQQAWITSQLSGRPAGTHAFVMSHKGLITENHVDVLFGSDPSKDPAGQNAFFSSLYDNNVHYYICGHDHMHDRSIITSPSGTSSVTHLLAASDSSKFYTPGNPSNDDKYNVPAFGRKRQTQVAQELHTVGYYVFTVDGPRVTVDYYSAVPSNVAPNGCSGANCEYLIPTTPALSFVKAETFGYSLNGKEFQVPQGAAYTSVTDTYNGTTARILGGVNNSTAADFNGRHFTKAVDTGWSDMAAGFASNILTLWGMGDLYSPNTDTFTLSMTYNGSQAQNGVYSLVTLDPGTGNWVKAVDKNVGGTPTFVNGAYNSSYALGTYGIDPATNTAWAVINHNSDYAVAPLSVSDVSGQISAATSGFVYSRASKLYIGTVTITNTGAAITGPVAVALNSLTSGVTLTNALGQYNSAPYTSITNSGLAAGASITIPLSFSNPSNAKINFNPVTFQE